jgi:hypothetical protein
VSIVSIEEIAWGIGADVEACGTMGATTMHGLKLWKGKGLPHGALESVEGPGTDILTTCDLKLQFPRSQQ